MNSFEAEVVNLKRSSVFFAPDRPIHIARSPGRLDLMGGNVDYTGGLVFQATIREATWAAVQLRPDGLLVFLNPQMSQNGWRERVEFALGELGNEEAVRALVNRSPEIRWTAYTLGVFYLLKQKWPESVKTGASIYIESEIPLNKGVSSSAAVEVAVMKAAAKAYGIELAGIELAQACQWVENVIAESACGIMDQAAVVLGDEGCILPLLCQPCIPSPLVRLPEQLACWAIDSGVSHAVTGIEYEAARAAAFIGYKLICGWEGLPVQLEDCSIPRYVDSRWNGYLSDVPPSLFRSSYEHRLPEALTGGEFLATGQVHADPFTVVRPEIQYWVRAATRYSIEENHRIRLFTELARGAGESEAAFRLMGELMYQSHFSYTECGLGCEVTDFLVDLVRAEGPESGLYGAKITGGGAGGTVAVLGRRDAGAALRRVTSRFAESRRFAPYVFEGSSIGADRFGTVTLEP